MKQRKKQFLVLGLGRFGSSVARHLSEMGHEVLAVDTDQESVDDVAPYVTQAVVADATDEEVLASFEPSSFDAAIVSIGSNVANSTLVSLLCKEAGVKLVVAKASDELHAKVLRKIGVDRVIFPERDMGIRLAKSLVIPGVHELMDIGGDYQIAEIALPASWSGKTLAQLNVRRVYNLSVLAVTRAGKMIASPGADTALMAGDTLLVLGKQEDIDEL